MRHQVVASLIVAAAAALLVGQWLVYDVTPLSQTNRGRAVLTAAVLVVLGLRMLLAPGVGHEIAVRAAMLAGATLVLFALLAPHASAAATAVEGLSGVVVVVAAMTALPPLTPPRR